VRGISTQRARVAVLVSAQWKSSVFVLASGVVRRGWVWQQRSARRPKGFSIWEGALSLYRRRSLAAAGLCVLGGGLARRLLL
jgi:hypothetical protein